MFGRMCEFQYENSILPIITSAYLKYIISSFTLILRDLTAFLNKIY